MGFCILHEIINDQINGERPWSGNISHLHNQFKSIRLMNSLFKSSISLFGSFFHLPLKPQGSKSSWRNSVTEVESRVPWVFEWATTFFLFVAHSFFFLNGFLVIGVLVESQRDQCTKYFIAVIVCCLYLRVLWATRLNHDIIMSSSLAFSCLKTSPRDTPLQRSRRCSSRG